MPEFPEWTHEALDAELRAAADLFDERRRRDLAQRSRERYEQTSESVELLFSISDDLRDVNALVNAAEAEASAPRQSTGRTAFLDALRLLTMPPLGFDDLPGLERASSRAVLLDSSEYLALRRILSQRIDSARFPWIAESRDPSACERQIAIAATASLAVGQALSAYGRFAMTDDERHFARTLRRLGWDEVPSSLSLRQLAAGSFQRLRIKGGDYAARHPDGALLLIEVKTGGGKSRLTRSPRRTFGAPRRVYGVTTPGPQELSEEGTPVLVLIGALPTEEVLATQAAGVAIVLEGKLDDVLSLHQSSDADAEVGPRSVRNAEEAEAVVRETARQVRTHLQAKAHVGRLGRRKGAPPGDPYVGQYVHIESTIYGPLSVWIYYAGSESPYGIPGYPSGFWLGLKQSVNRELPQEAWSDFLSPTFQWMGHEDERFAGFRAFLGNPPTASLADAEKEIASAAIDAITKAEIA